MRAFASIMLVMASGLAATASEPAGREVAAGLAAEARFDPVAALEHFRAAVMLRPDDAFLHQKIARQLSDRTLAETDPARKRAWVDEALVHAKRALALDAQNAENVLSLAVLYGKLGLYADRSHQVEYARLVKDYAEQALGLDPDYAWAHHVLGQWHGAIADLGATRRFLAGLLFGGLPAASRETGLRHLRRAVELAPDVMAHQVELGFACAASGKRDEARQHWQRALALPDRALEDPYVRARATAALAETARP